MSAHRPDITGPLSVTECKMLAAYARDSEATCALEVGHYLGLSTAVLLQALPADCSLTTIDHHTGDAWAPESSQIDFEENIAPYVGGRVFTPIYEDMRIALVRLARGRFDFVFYDADHSADAVVEFWVLVREALAERCTLVFDDADWDDQSTLTRMAEKDGFVGIRERVFVRHPEQDKRDPKTYTLEIMRRGLPLVINTGDD